MNNIKLLSRSEMKNIKGGYTENDECNCLFCIYNEGVEVHTLTAVNGVNVCNGDPKSYCDGYIPGYSDENTRGIWGIC